VERVIWAMMVAMMDLILEVEELSNLLENLTIKISTNMRIIIIGWMKK